MRIAYYNPLVNEPLGCGIHGRGLVAGWRAMDIEVLVIPDVVSVDGGAVSRVGRFSRYPEWAKVPARDVRACIRFARSGAETMRRIREFAPDVIVIRRHAYDYIADALAGSGIAPVVAEVNAVAYVEAARHWHEWTLPWERRRERRFLGLCDRLACVTEDVVEQVRSVGVTPRESVIVPNGVDAEAFSPDLVPDPQTKAWARGFDIVLGYAGKGGGLHDIECMARASSRLTEAGFDVGYLFVGPSVGEIDFEVPADRIRCTGMTRHSEVGRHLACADILWAAFRNTYGSPLKLYEYLAMGRPFVLSMEGAAVREAEASGGGVVVGRGDDSSLAREIERLLEDEPMRRSYGTRGRKWVLEHGSWESSAAKMIDGVITLQTPGERARTGAAGS